MVIENRFSGSRKNGEMARCFYLFAVLVLTFGLSATSSAGQFKIPKKLEGYYKIAQMHIEEVEDTVVENRTEELKELFAARRSSNNPFRLNNDPDFDEPDWDDDPDYYDPNNPSSGSAGIWNTIDNLIRLGKEAWQVVSSNKAVADYETDSVSVVPEGITSWQQLGEWEKPRVKTYHIWYENYFKVKVVDFKYMVLFTPGGNLGGKGKFLTHTTILPKNVDVALGWKLHAVATVDRPTNVGTAGEPIAALQLIFRWRVESPLTLVDDTAVHYVRGDGQLENIIEAIE